MLFFGIDANLLIFLNDFLILRFFKLVKLGFSLILAQDMHIIDLTIGQPTCN